MTTRPDPTSWNVSTTDDGDDVTLALGSMTLATLSPDRARRLAAALDAAAERAAAHRWAMLDRFVFGPSADELATVIIDQARAELDARADHARLNAQSKAPGAPSPITGRVAP